MPSMAENKKCCNTQNPHTRFDKLTHIHTDDCESASLFSDIMNVPTLGERKWVGVLCQC